MPLFHCKKCHHEWESSESKSDCDWCGESGYVIKEKTELEVLIDYMFENDDFLLRK